MTSGIEQGFDHAVWALGWLLGVIPVIFLAGSTILAAYALYRLLEHRLRVIRLRRAARRDGRQFTHRGITAWPGR